MINGSRTLAKALVSGVAVVATTAAVFREGRAAAPADLPDRIPEAAPYVASEAQVFPPPYEEHWKKDNAAGQCQTCHQRIFDQWNGSMMSNSWRDPVWRAAFLAQARATSTNGNCDTPAPPDGTARATPNPFAAGNECASTFDTGTGRVTVSHAGSLLDGFCARCHMPTNYVDNVPFRTLHADPSRQVEVGSLDPDFHPTSDNGTGLAFATVEAQLRNTESGKSGVFCAVCHTYAATRDTPFHNYSRHGTEYVPAVGATSRSQLLPPGQQNLFQVADPTLPNLGYAVGAGSFRLSPHAIALGERFGPLTAGEPPTATDAYTSQIFGVPIPYQRMDEAKHHGYHQEMFLRAEMCSACHDVTNALPIRNTAGKWVGGFPIERTYTEWSTSRYADRPGNPYFDPAYKRDCQSCHMQQDYGQPGTAQTLYHDGRPLPPQVDRVATDGAPRPFFTHHFVGGNAFVPGLIGKDLDAGGSVSPYPELSTFSFSSADPRSPYSRAFWTHLERRGTYTQQARLAWDRLRHVLTMDVSGPTTTSAGRSRPLTITLTNTGSGHKFPSGFPEGRIAWLAVHAYDLSTGNELAIHDAVWNRTSLGVGNLTREEMLDPHYPARCRWKIPAGSADPYAVQFKAVASLGDGCPTLNLGYAAPLNLVTNAQGMPVDRNGRVIGPDNPGGLPQFRDLNGNGDLFDDAYLVDSRLQPLPHPGATLKTDRYSVVVPPGTRGPIAVTVAVYYQSVEAEVALMFLGNLADTNGDFVLQPCVLGGLCDGRHPNTEPAVVEGSPPVPMVVRSWLIDVEGALPRRPAPPRPAVYPSPDAPDAYQDVVVKVFFSSPVQGVDAASFTLTGPHGPVPASVDRIGPGTWALFPDQVLLEPGQRYTARLQAGVCDPRGGCTQHDLIWSFTVSREPGGGAGDTGLPSGFDLPGTIGQNH